MSHCALLTKSPTLSRNRGEKSTSRPRLSLTTPRVLESIFPNSSMYSSRLSNIRPEVCTDPNSTDRLSSANWETCGDGILVKIVFSGCCNHVLDSSLNYVAMIIGSSNGSTEGFTWRRFCLSIGSEFVRNTISALARSYSCWHMFNYAHFHFSVQVI